MDYGPPMPSRKSLVSDRRGTVRPSIDLRNTLLKRHNVTYGNLQKAIIRGAQGGEKGELARQDAMRKGVGRGRLAGGDVGGDHLIGFKVEGRNRDVDLVVHIGPSSIKAHHHAIGDISGLKAYHVVWVADIQYPVGPPHRFWPG